MTVKATLASAFCCLLFWIFPQFLAAQPTVAAAKNLVENPSFEKLAPGRELALSSAIDVADGWDSPTGNKAMLYTTTQKGHIYDPHGSSWPFAARTGKNVAGMNVYGREDDGELREYIQGSLIEPLTVGKRYYFEFYVHYHCRGANNIGIAFLPEKISVDEASLLRLEPVSYQREVTPFNNDVNTWTLVRDSFTAVKPYQSFVIGNFFPNSETQLESSISGHYFGYIDDIVVAEAAGQPETLSELSQEEVKKWEYNTKVSQNVEILAKAPEPESVSEPETPEPEIEIPAAPAVRLLHFAAGSSLLSSEYAPALDALAQQMVQHPSVRLLIQGFASSEGSNAFNQALSERRAQEVQAQLIGKGIDAERIEIKAFGIEQPVADNSTPAGRSKNRRVELIWADD